MTAYSARLTTSPDTSWMRDPRPDWAHRAASHVGGVLLSWGARPVRAPAPLTYAERVAGFETARDAAARRLPQLPR